MPLSLKLGICKRILFQIDCMHDNAELARNCFHNSVSPKDSTKNIVNEEFMFGVESFDLS